MRTCRACLVAKPAHEFHKHPIAHDGSQATCKPCKRAYNRRRREAIKSDTWGHPGRGRGDNYGYQWHTTPTAMVSPSMKDLHWAAGFIEGEGSFMKHGNSVTVCAAQVQLEPLERLQQFFGGRLTFRRDDALRRPCHGWQVHGARARG